MRSRLLAVWIWLIGSMAVIMQFVVQLSSGAMVDGLTYSFHLSGASAGMLAGAYYPVYCILQVPAGVIVSRIGAQKFSNYRHASCQLGNYVLCIR